MKYTPEMKGKKLGTILKAHGLKVTDKIPGIAIGVEGIGQQQKQSHKLLQAVAKKLGVEEPEEEQKKKDRKEEQVEQQEVEQQEEQKPEAEEKKAEEAPAAESAAAPAALRGVPAPDPNRPSSDGESSESEEGESSESEDANEGSDAEQPSAKWTLEQWRECAKDRYRIAMVHLTNVRELEGKVAKAEGEAEHWEEKALELQTENEALKRALQQRTEKAEKKKAKHT